MFQLRTIHIVEQSTQLPNNYHQDTTSLPTPTEQDIVIHSQHTIVHGMYTCYTIYVNTPLCWCKQDISC